MEPWAWAMIAAVPAAVAGLLTRRRVASLSYRRDDETQLPDPGPRWWIPGATVLGVTVLVARLASPEQWPSLLPTMPVAVWGPWLAAIDLDVQRLPDKLLAPLAAVVGVGVVGSALASGEPVVVGRAVAGGLLSLFGYRLLHRASRGGLGLGDVKLGGILGLATASISLTTLWWSVMIGSIGAAVWALVTRRRNTSFPYGPWLIAGAIAALLLA